MMYLVTESLRHWLPRLHAEWPDPFLGLARTFIYGLEDIDRGADAMNQIAADMRRASAQRYRQKAAAIAPRVTLLTTVVMVPGAMILLIVGLYIGSDLDLGSFGGI